MKYKEEGPSRVEVQTCIEYLNWIELNRNEWLIFKFN